MATTRLKWPLRFGGRRGPPGGERDGKAKLAVAAAVAAAAAVRPNLNREEEGTLLSPSNEINTGDAVLTFFKL